METITNSSVQVICDYLCNDMEYLTKDAFLVELAPYAPLAVLTALWDWYWKLTPLERFEFDYPEYSAKINELNK